jgi:hypothetical protein
MAQPQPTQPSSSDNNQPLPVSIHGWPTELEARLDRIEAALARIEALLEVQG